MEVQLVKQLGVPVLALTVGSALVVSRKTQPVGKLCLFFGGNSCMNLYMKSVLSASIVSKEEGLRGVPAPFALTAIQQLVSFVLFVVWMLVSFPTRCRYAPRVLRTRRDVGNVCLFAFAFTGNIALNNYSIQLLPLSVNLVIRACLPCATTVVQILMAWCQGQPAKDARPIELVLVALGVLSAVVVVIADMQGNGSPGGSQDILFGILVCVGALCFKALNIVLAAVLGSSSKLNALDTTLYMSIPVALILTAPVLTYRHDPETWPGYGHLTDWEVVSKVAILNPGVLVLVFASGGLALFYNALSWSIVHTLSAGTLAFAENFNNSATIAIGVIVGLDHLPPGWWGVLFVTAVSSSILAFAAFSYVKISALDTAASPTVSPCEARATEESGDLRSQGVSLLAMRAQAP